MSVKCVFCGLSHTEIASFPTRVRTYSEINLTDNRKLCGICVACNGKKVCYCGYAPKFEMKLYDYDIFFAQQCCARRIRCRICGEEAVEYDPSLRPEDYDKMIPCMSCGVLGRHLVKEGMHLEINYHDKKDYFVPIMLGNPVERVDGITIPVPSTQVSGTISSFYLGSSYH